MTERDCLIEPSDELIAESEEREIRAEASDAGMRADAFLANHTELSRSAAVRLMESGYVRINGATVDKKYKIKAGDRCTVLLPESEPDEAQPEDIPLDVVYEDGDIIVINKPKGMVVHPAPGNPTGTLVNALLYHCKGSLSGIGGVIRPGIVHRIDKDTEGLLVVAKNDKAHLSLAEQIKTHDVRRVYYALVHGNLREDQGTVDAPIGRHPVDRKKMAVIRDPEKRAREAITHWTVLERFGAFTWIRCELETGRTHQIRVHLSHIGHPLMGDTLYGGGGSRFEARHKKWIDGQCLVACELILAHPADGREMHFRVPIPQPMEELLGILRQECE
ncbi:MAG: RluA family pseudouridine synthase [Clostridia bacterium]|nr:RluA family pseudouridine synthase [Clostridia bacterium]